MELREIAQQVLFAESLELKLACPEVVTDDAPGEALPSPGEPGRPGDLRFFRGRTKFEFPRAHHLEREEARGRLLHFFANHELLATELMALVLLKFPDAPKAFRRGVLRTLRDEQEHTRIYLERLRQLGVEFGQYPVSGFFWKVIAPMESPLAYVSRLALTFEQANLDFSGHYASQFRIIGDHATEGILERIHRDEIGHVGYGLRWFRRWKDPALTDWEAFRQQLTFPLSPSRAKAAPFDREARRRAGLDAEFIDELFVYAKSKGRTPSVYFFNPLAEWSMGSGRPHQRRLGSHAPPRAAEVPARTPRANLVAMARDLAMLPTFLAREDDVVLVPRRPSTPFLAQLKRVGIDLPQFEELNADHRLKAESELRQRKLGALRPWAWSPDSIAVLEPLIPGLTRPGLPVGEEWERNLRPWFAKCYGVRILREFTRTCNDRAWLCPDAHFGVRVESYSEALTTIESIHAGGTDRAVAKALFGCAGNAMLRFKDREPSEAERRWLQKQLDTEGALVIEPWLDRIVDFSLQLEMESDRLRSLGLVRLENDGRGQFLQSHVTPRFTEGFGRELARFVHGPSGDRLKQLFEALACFLEPRLRMTGFRGPIGVDAFIYRDTPGTLRLKPMVEINPRYTMGRLALELSRYAAPGRCGSLELVNRGALRRHGLANFGQYAERLAAHSPLELAEPPGRGISSGSLCLNDPESAEVCLAVFHVSKRCSIVLGREA